MIKDDWEIVKGDDVRPRAGSDLSNSSSGSHDLTYDKKLSKISIQSSDKRHIDSIVSDNQTEKESQKSDSLVNGMDFFNKYDDNIAQLKDKLAKLEQSSR